MPGAHRRACPGGSGNGEGEAPAEPGSWTVVAPPGQAEREATNGGRRKDVYYNKGSGIRYFVIHEGIHESKDHHSGAACTDRRWGVQRTAMGAATAKCP